MAKAKAGKRVKDWLRVLERLYAVFRLAPFGAPRIRAVKKEQKHYHFDWSVVAADGPRFENLVAAHLLKWTHYLLDFVVVENRLPLLLVEGKWADAEVDRGLRYLTLRFPEAQAWQLSAVGGKDYQTGEGIRVAPAQRLLADLV